MISRDEFNRINQAYYTILIIANLYKHSGKPIICTPTAPCYPNGRGISLMSIARTRNSLQTRSRWH